MSQSQALIVTFTLLFAAAANHAAVSDDGTTAMQLTDSIACRVLLDAAVATEYPRTFTDDQLAKLAARSKPPKNNRQSQMRKSNSKLAGELAAEPQTHQIVSIATTLSCLQQPDHSERFRLPKVNITCD